MKRAFSLLLATLAVCHAAPEDAVAEKLKLLFRRADVDRNGVLTPAEQAPAVEFVKKSFGDEWSQRIAQMFTSTASADGAVSGERWLAEVGRLAAPIEKKVEMVAMRDGKRLATDVYLPKGDGPFPVILARTPYGRTKRGGEGGGFTRDGYVFVVQDQRGRFDSEGENLPFVGCGWGEHQDGVDTIAWLKKQPWCNGRIATIGGSAGGITQNLLAGAAPAGLEAQYISVAASNFYTDAFYIGSAFRKADAENWITGNRYDQRALEMGHAHPSYDAYWRDYDTGTKFAEMKVPAVHIGGWFDMFAQGTIDQFVGRQYRGGEGARGQQKLIMGPWTHGIGKMPVGELTFPNAKPPTQYGASRWFDHYLKGVANGVEKEPAVAYFVMGDAKTPGAPGNEWRYASDWPIPAKETAVYLSADATLRLEKPTADEARVEYTFDPASPCPTIGGQNLTLERGPMDQSKVESRKDAVVFTSAPLDKPVEVTGRLTAEIFVASSAVDTDLSVRICDVYPDGKSYLITEGIQRVRYRKSAEKPELLTPGKVEEVTVDCWSTSIVFNQGHRVRVMVTSSNFPRFDVNPGTGEPWSESGAKVKQTNTIYCDAARPSRLIVPVIPAK